MSETTRIQGTEGVAPALDEWWLDLPEPKVADTWNAEDGGAAYDLLNESLAGLSDGLDGTDTMLADAVRYLAERDDLEALVDIAGRLQALKRGLAIAEAYVARETGRLAAVLDCREGFLPDGRPFQVRRSANRKAWDHDGWKRDARNAIVAQHGIPADLIDPDTGESVNVVTLMAEAEAVHGSAAPKVTALKALGLSAGDYCQTTAGPYTVTITTPEN